jgi:hypothetical protein
MLGPDEWRQIEYLLWITRPFFKFTTILSKTKDVTVHTVFEIYNSLFDHLDDSISQLRRKKISWKKLMLTALEASRNKLSVYYTKTEGMRGDLFAIRTILAPNKKLQYFSISEWEGGWRDRYYQSIQDYFEPYQQYFLHNQSESISQPLSVQTSELDAFLTISRRRDTSILTPKSGNQNKLTQYLESGLYFCPIYYIYN